MDQTEGNTKVNGGTAKLAKKKSEPLEAIHRRIRKRRAGKFCNLAGDLFSNVGLI